MAAQGIAGHTAVTLYDVEDPLRHAGLDRQLGDAQHTERRHLGRLEDDGISCRQCRCHLPRSHYERQVPGCDGADDAVGFRDRHAEMVCARRRDVTADLVRPLRKEADAVRSERHVPARCILDRPRRTNRLERRKRLHIGIDQVRPAAQDACAVARRAARPVAGLECAPGILHRLVDEVRIRHRQAGIALSIGWTFHVHRVRTALHIAPTDKMRTAHCNLIRVEAFHHQSFQ